MNLNYLLLLGLLSVECSAQLVFSTSSNPAGISASVFEQLTPGGPVTRLNTGFAEMNYTSLSRDGGTIIFSVPDPVDPFTQIPPSSDLYRFDRATGQTIRLAEQESLIGQSPRGLQTTAFTPEFNALSPDGSVVIFSNRITLRDGLANPQEGNNLIFARADGSNFGDVIETGMGEAIDLFNSEFVGISWAPDGQSFVTSGYIPTFSPLGGFTLAAGIVRFSRNGNGFTRSGVLSIPQITTTDGIRSQFQIQIMPAFSPSGNSLAYFDIFFPSPLLDAPATVRLIVANADGSGATIRVPFSPGGYPLGLAWSADGSQLAFSIAPQIQSGGIFSAAGDASRAEIFTTAAFGGDTGVNQIPGVNAGFLPNLPAVSPVVTPPPSVDLSNVPINLTPSSNGGFTLQVDGLDSGASYVVESSTTLPNFVNPQTFSGQDLMNGLSIPSTQGGSRFFRIRNPN